MKLIWLLITFFCTLNYACLGSNTSIFFKGGVVFFEQPKINIGHIYGIKLTPVNPTVTTSDVDTYFPHLIENMGNSSDKVRFEFIYISNLKGWSAMLIRDDNGNGSPEANENFKMENEIQLSEGSAVHFFVKLTRPSDTKSGDSGSAKLLVACSVKDGVSYIGYNGTSYGGIDEMETTDTVLVK